MGILDFFVLGTSFLSRFGQLRIESPQFVELFPCVAPAIGSLNFWLRSLYLFLGLGLGRLWLSQQNRRLETQELLQQLPAVGRIPHLKYPQVSGLYFPQGTEDNRHAARLATIHFHRPSLSEGRIWFDTRIDHPHSLEPSL